MPAIARFFPSGKRTALLFLCAYALSAEQREIATGLALEAVGADSNASGASIDDADYRPPRPAYLLPLDPAPAEPVIPVPKVPKLEKETPEPKGVNWAGVLSQSFRFLLVEQGFRYGTEEGARHTHMPFFAGWKNSVTNLHGWADGDPFYVNYVGHPMQGSVAGFIWVHNDGEYAKAEFGKNGAYWKSRLRATAWAWAYSEQFEIGPFSEANIGTTQALFPEQGFVDHIITPVIGLGWMLAEDFIDRYFIRWVETKTRNPYYLLLLRGGLNPSRSMANAMAFRVPWIRDTRAGVFRHTPVAAAVERSAATYPKAAPVEIQTAVKFQKFLGSKSEGSCVGGGATGAYRVFPTLQLVLEVSGCEMLGLPTHVSGDSLSYLIGPRWAPHAGDRWSPYAQILIGGNKITREEFFPDQKAALEAQLRAQGKKLDFQDHLKYTREWDADGFAISAGTGVDLKLNSALALHVASLEYQYSWAGNLDGTNYRHALQFTSGLVLRMGTW